MTNAERRAAVDHAKRVIADVLRPLDDALRQLATEEARDELDACERCWSSKGDGCLCAVIWTPIDNTDSEGNQS